VAVAALRSPDVREARPDDHAAVLKVWSKRRRDLASSRTQVVCRLHAVLCELVPGGVAKTIIAAHAARLLESITPPDAVAAARSETDWISSVLTEIEAFRALARYAPEAESRLPAVLDLIDLLPLDRGLLAILQSDIPR
jgi:hypothetical protein